jgi:hypothetical protein
VELPFEVDIVAVAVVVEVDLEIAMETIHGEGEDDV